MNPSEYLLSQLVTSTNTISRRTNEFITMERSHLVLDAQLGSVCTENVKEVPVAVPGSDVHCRLAVLKQYLFGFQLELFG